MNNQKNKGELDSFVTYRSYHESLKELTFEQYGRIMFAINEYSLYGLEPDFKDPVDKALWSVFSKMAEHSRSISLKRKHANEQRKNYNGGAPEGNKNAQKPDIQQNSKQQQNSNNCKQNNNKTTTKQQQTTTNENKTTTVGSRELGVGSKDLGDGLDSSLHSESLSSDDDAKVDELELIPEEGLPNDVTVDYKGLVIFFNDTLKKYKSQIRPIVNIKDKRRGKVNARIRDYGKQALATVFEKAANSDYLNGGGKQGFVATFDWLISPENFRKVLEGNYDNRIQAGLNMYQPTNGASMALKANQCSTNKDWLKPGEEFEKPIPISQMTSEANQ